MLGLAPTVLMTFIPVVRLCSTSTRGTLFAAGSSRTLTWDDYRAADEVGLWPEGSFPRADWVAGHADWRPRPSGGFSSNVTPLVGQNEFRYMMKSSYDS